ncbi:MAG: 4-(cytidine 5'-diphospho)-2-C-methyl-D-erythritol kinase [Thermoguttaceae bacterium]
MRVRRSATEVVVDAPAKLNLFFEVLRKRPDGYHEIETLMCPIDIYDTLRVRDNADASIRFECRCVGGAADCGLDQVPGGPENLVVRAIELVRRQARVHRGADVSLVKRIPAAAGLGGGSSDAAAAIVAVNEVWGLGRSRDELADWAAQLGSDIPFFLVDGPAVCRGRGERISPIRGMPGLSFVVVRPPDGLATPDVYRACRPAPAPVSVGQAVERFACGDPALAGRCLWNGLQAAAERLSPWVKRLEERFAQLDCLGHAMSGSGTSYFGLCRHARHARRSARRLRAMGLGAVFAARGCR